MYLDATDRYVRRYPDSPEWTRQFLAIWEATLAALRRDDQEWLEVRLDPWIKHRLFREYLAAHNARWDDLCCDQDLASGLALLNQNYHDFTDPHSAFDQLDRAGLLQHRVGPDIVPGAEEEPFVPEVSTRAAARARFIRDHAGDDHLRVDWDSVEDCRDGRIRKLDDPWATGFSDPG